MLSVCVLLVYTVIVPSTLLIFGHKGVVHRESMLYGVVGKLGGIWWRFSVYFACFAPSPTLVFVNARNRHNVITLERIGNMVQVFAGIPPRHVCVCICFLFMKAWFKVLYFGVERYFFM